MSWTAVVPLKNRAERKTRLAQVLAPGERIQLADAMVRRVIAALQRASAVSRVLLLSPTPLEACNAQWVEDKGAGLNLELTRARTSLAGPMLIVHADLPLLSHDDIAVLIAASEEKGAAIAPDHRGEGTNAIALADSRPFQFAFGRRSFLAHKVQGSSAVVQRVGLAFDVDLPGDVAVLRQVVCMDLAEAAEKLRVRTAK